MPETGIKYVPKKELLSFEEIIRLVRMMAEMGIAKIRLTGGEPFLRHDLMQLIRMIRGIKGIEDIHLTTNGLLTGPHIPELKQLGIASVNLSLDTLDRERFKQITRRDEFLNTLKTLEQLRANEIPVKINAVVMEGKNIEDIIPMVELTRDQNCSVRFIEEMPFNGTSHAHDFKWNHRAILNYIAAHYPQIEKIADPANSTAYHYQIPGFHGTIGIIAAFSRTFCGTCNRIRVTAQGVLKTCLYDEGVLNVRDLLRKESDDGLVRTRLLEAFQSRPADGFEAQQRRSDTSIHESMSIIGG